MKLGRRAPKNAPALLLSRLLTGVVPAHPVAVDHLAGLSGWQMLGNDRYGDCVSVMWANNRRQVTAMLATERYATLAQVLTLYRTQNPNFPTDDNGMDIQTCLEYLVRSGGPDGVKAVAFARVDHTNRAEVEAATAIFGGLCTGISVESANQADFSAGRPWDYHGTAIEGGHAVYSGGYTGQASNDERFITWGAETGFTDAFWDHLTDELWVVIWPEHLTDKQFLAGIDLAALAADFKAITGRDLPIPAPAPVPVPPAPAPPGCLDAADKALASALAPWVAARHSGLNRVAQIAVQAWLGAKFAKESR